MTAGRPTKYKPEMCQKAIDFMTQGYSKEATAAHLDISEDSLYEYIKKHPEFSEAIKEGSLKSRLWWEKLGMGGAAGKLAGFNATAWIFNMKNRHNWKDKIETDITSGGEKIKNEWHIHPVTTSKNGED